MSLTKPFSASGFTLIEILVALVINVILLFALVTVFSSNLAHFNATSKSDMLNEQLESALQLMANDIRRAGYWSNVSSNIGTGVNSNPFMATATDLTINSTNNCVLFTYDHNKTGTLPNIAAGSDDDRYGYALNNQTLQARPPGTAFSCPTTGSAWENVTTPGIVQITALSFVLTATTVPVGQVANTLSLRTVLITITGQLTSNTAVTKTLSQLVRIRNDKFVP